MKKSHIAIISPDLDLQLKGRIVLADFAGMVWRFVLHLCCEHEIRMVPDMAFFLEMADKTFPARCKACGHIRMITGSQAAIAQNNGDIMKGVLYIDTSF